VPHRCGCASSRGGVWHGPRREQRPAPARACKRCSVRQSAG